MDSNYSLSDIAALNGNDMGGNSWIVLIILFAMIFGWGGSGFGGNATRVGEAYATQADVQRAVDLDTIKSSINDTGASTITAVKDSAYNNLGEIRDVQAAINTGFANQASCCCEVKQSVLESQYLTAQAIAQSEANTTAKIQSVLDKLAQDKIDSLQSQLNTVQMQQAIQNAMCGVPKVNPYLYGISQNGCGCSSLATV